MDDHNIEMLAAAISHAQNLTYVCYRTIPSSVNSRGIFGEGEKSPTHFLKYSLPLLQLQIALICLLHHALYFILKPCGITEFVSQVLTGLILGPTFLGRFEYMRNVIFPHESQDLIYKASVLGFVIYVFLCTVRLDITQILKTGKMVICSGIGNVIAPLLLCLGFIAYNAKDFRRNGSLTEASSVAILQSFSTFSIIVHVLQELRLLKTEIGRLIMSSSLIGDIVGIVLVFVIQTIEQGSLKNVIAIALEVIGYNLAVAFVFHPAMLWVIRHTPPGSPVKLTYIFLIMVVVFGSLVYNQYFKQVATVGATILGFAVPHGPPLGSALVEKFEAITNGVLMPVAVAINVMKADLSLIISKFSTIKFYLVLILLSFGSKILTSLLASMFLMMPLKDCVLFAVVMTCRGVVELGLRGRSRDAKIVSDEAYSVLVLDILLSSAFVITVVRFMYDPSRKYAGYETRNILSLKPKSHLRILVCIHKPENVTSTISLLDAFHPNFDRPIDVSVLHLIQLIGRATPVLMSHQRKNPITVPQSQNVIFSFTKYQRNKWDMVSVSNFTAISPIKLMNEDISLLAIDKLTSLILLPLHRRWSIRGTREAEDNNIRTVNWKVLEKAPSSVGIFFDRGKLGRRAPIASHERPPISICMIFVGGNDDREALSLSERIARDSRSNVTVIHLISEAYQNKETNSDEKVLDHCALEEVKQTTFGNERISNIEYKQHFVNEGRETALLVHSIADKYDLFLLGRRHGIRSPQTEGLSEWIELPELGVIGDLLASNDVSSRAAVLVVQQQKQNCQYWKWVD